MMLSVKRAALRRCLTNLVDNALKQGRKVAVAISRDNPFCRDRGGG